MISRVDALEGPTKTLHRGDGGLCAEAQAATRIPTGHPEGFYEAFGNVYRGARAAILGEDPTIDYPTLDDGVRGVRFIRAAIDRGLGETGWTAL